MTSREARRGGDNGGRREKGKTRQIAKRREGEDEKETNAKGFLEGQKSRG